MSESAWERYMDRQLKRISDKQDDSDLADEHIQRLTQAALANDGGEQPDWLLWAGLRAMQRANHVNFIEALKDVRDLREVVRDCPDMQIAVEMLKKTRETAIRYRVSELVLSTPSGRTLTEEEARNATLSEEEHEAFIAQAEAEIDAEDEQ